MTSRRVVFPLVGITALLWLSPLGARAGAPGHDIRSNAIWITAGWSLELLDAAAPRASHYAFDNPPAMIVGNEDGSQNQVPAGYASVPMLKYESFARFQNDLLDGSISPTIGAVGYDPENWPLTPLEERQDPVRYMTEFADLAHSYGYEVFLSPARDLTLVPDGSCERDTNEGLSHAYLRCGLAGAAALSGDIIDIQSQSLEIREHLFARFVERATLQARAANPSVVVLAGLSTSPGYLATEDVMLSAWTVVRHRVDGAYVTINAVDTPTAIAFFRAVRARGH